MGKIRTRLQPHSAGVPEAIVVDRPTTVTTQVLRAFRDLLKDPSIGFAEVQLADNEVKFELSGTTVRGTARDKYAVFLLLQTGSELFWLGSSLVFKKELGRYSLKSVSLVIFKGEVIDERKTALLRAEWDIAEAGVLHAQPHWHIYPRVLYRESQDAEFERVDEPELVESSFEEEMDGPEQDPEWSTSANFHYAMASTWQTNGIGAQQEKLNDLDSLVRWIHGCVTYSRQQIAWLFS
jgi:hypothetical protein